MVRENGKITIAETEDHGNAEELEPEVDIVLIDELVREAARVIG